MNTAMLKRKLGAPEKRALADFLPTLGIKAKDFAADDQQCFTRRFIERKLKTDN